MSAVEHCCLTIMRGRLEEGKKRREIDLSLLCFFFISANIFLCIHFANMCTNTNTTTTRSIVTDYFNWRLISQTITDNRLFFLIRQIAYDCETTYYAQQPTFHFQFSSSSLNHLENVHYEIAKELFNDGNITWTRIITLISFSAILAERVIQQQPQNRELVIASFVDWTTNFIDTDLHSWLEDQNYWVSSFKINKSFRRFIFSSRLDV